MGKSKAPKKERRSGDRILDLGQHPGPRMGPGEGILGLPPLDQLPMGTTSLGEVNEVLPRPGSGA